MDGGKKKKKEKKEKTLHFTSYRIRSAGMKSCPVCEGIETVTHVQIWHIDKM